jgi:hypothetical protein
MEAELIKSETSVSFYETTQRNNPEDGHLHTRRRENLKTTASSKDLLCCVIFFELLNPNCRKPAWCIKTG